jgi:hypothetical protein
MQLKTKVVATIAGLLLGVSIVGSLINYHKNVQDAQAQLQSTSLPLSVDNIYTEVQQRMIEPLLVSSLMSHDTFLRDWIMGGEGNIVILPKSSENTMCLRHFWSLTKPKTTTTPKVLSIPLTNKTAPTHVFSLQRAE